MWVHCPQVFPIVRCVAADSAAVKRVYLRPWMVTLDATARLTQQPWPSVKANDRSKLSAGTCTRTCNGSTCCANDQKAGGESIGICKSDKLKLSAGRQAVRSCWRELGGSAHCLRAGGAAIPNTQQDTRHCTWNGCVAHQSAPGPRCRLVGSSWRSVVLPAQWLKPRWA